MTFREKIALFIRKIKEKVCDHKTIHSFSPEGRHCAICGKLIGPGEKGNKLL